MTFRALTFAFMTEFRLQRINVPAYYPMNSIIKNQLEVYVVDVFLFYNPRNNDWHASLGASVKAYIGSNQLSSKYCHCRIFCHVFLNEQISSFNPQTHPPAIVSLENIQCSADVCVVVQSVLCYSLCCGTVSVLWYSPCCGTVCVVVQSPCCGTVRVVVQSVLWYSLCCGTVCVVVQSVLWYSLCCGTVCVVVQSVLWYSLCCGIVCVVV